MDERSRLIDALRGFALLGVFIMNVPSFNGYRYLQVMFEPDANQLAVESPHLWRAIMKVNMVLIAGKFYTIFSFLFGFGFAMLLQRAQKYDLRFLPLYLRRLSFLLFIGIIHAFFLWYGDILLTYGLLGFSLILFRKWTDKKLYILIVFLIFLPVVVQAITYIINPAQPAAEGLTPALNELFKSAFTTFATGTYADIFAMNLIGLAFSYQFLIQYGPNIVAMFLCGLIAGRRKWLTESHLYRPLYRRVFIITLLIGAAGTAGVVLIGKPQASHPYYAQLRMAHTLLWGVSLPCLAAAYISAFVLLWHGARSKRMLNLFSYPGRMTLTNYLMQTLLCLFIFYGYGLGLAGKIGMVPSLMIVFAVYTGQIFFSKWWLQQYHYGPMEWLWRQVTYWRILAPKRKTESAGVI